MFTYDISLRWIRNRISSWHTWNDDRTKKIVLPLLKDATRLNSQNTYETEIHNELWNIKLYMNTGISNWHIWSIVPTKMKYLPLFQFDTLLLFSKYPKLFSTLLLRRNEAVWNMCCSAAQNAKKEFQLKIKNKDWKWLFLEC